MHRKENAAFLDPAFIAFGLKLGNAHPHQRSRQTADGSTDTHTRQRGHDWTGGDERAQVPE